MHRIAILTSTRADWGILQPLAGELLATPGIEPVVVATGMHLLEEYGHTVDEVRTAFGGQVIEGAVEAEADTPAGAARTAGRTTVAIASVLESIAPDAALILGDRTEMLGAAMAAAVCGVPLVHLHGGEVTLGAVDNAMRAAITELATLHLTATPMARQRLLSKGVEAARVINTGALGVYNAMHAPRLSWQDVERHLGVNGWDARRTLLVTYHPVTRDDTGQSPGQSIAALTRALDMFPDTNIIWTHPNNDAGTDAVTVAIKEYALRRPNMVLVKSLGMIRYMTALDHVAAVVGNSSSGIIEAPSTQARTINIGPRQKGRDRAPGIIDVDARTPQIAAALERVLREKTAANPLANPYYRRDTLRLMTDSIVGFVQNLRHGEFV